MLELARWTTSGRSRTASERVEVNPAKRESGRVGRETRMSKEGRKQLQMTREGIGEVTSELRSYEDAS